MILELITLILAISIIIYYLPKIMIINSRINESSNIIQNIILEIRTRLDNQDKKVIDHEVKLEIIELKLSKIMNNILLNKNKNHDISLNQSKISYDIQSENNISKKNIGKLNETEQKILSILNEEEMTVKDLQVYIKKTREHTSRILQKLYLEGYINRKANKKPFKYKTNK